MLNFSHSRGLNRWFHQYFIQILMWSDLIDWKLILFFKKKWYFVGTFINDTYAVVLIKAIAFSYSRENRWREMSKYQQQRNETIRNRKTTTIRWIPKCCGTKIAMHFCGNQQHFNMPSGNCIRAEHLPNFLCNIVSHLE